MVGTSSTALIYYLKRNYQLCSDVPKLTKLHNTRQHLNPRHQEYNSPSITDIQLRNQFLDNSYEYYTHHNYHSEDLYILVKSVKQLSGYHIQNFHNQILSSFILLLGHFLIPGRKMQYKQWKRINMKNALCVAKVKKLQRLQSFAKVHLCILCCSFVVETHEWFDD